jgi:dihydroxyacetone kinase-like protein
LSSPDSLFLQLARAACAAVEQHADELTALDRAIGDADHGINMRRGFGAVAAKLDALAPLPLGAAVSEVGKTLVMTVGGASGPLFGTLFMRLGSGLPAEGEPTRADLARALRSAIEAVQARGRATLGQKTLIDVLDPLATRLADAEPLDADQLIECVHRAAQSTIPLRAEKGRASFLGERSCGHLDPGARSTEIIVAALVGAWHARRLDEGLT